MLREELKCRMLPVYDAGFISLDSQYLTIGVNGVVEAAEYLGYEISDNDEYKNWLKTILKTISDCNREGSEYYSNRFNCKVMFNTEFVPAENLGVKFSKWDKEDGLFSPRDCYNSYFYIVESNELDIYDKFNLYGRDIVQWLDGGSAFHANFNQLITDPETWKAIIRYSTKVGCNYWTYNVKSTVCSDCNYINKETLNYCIKCGSKKVKYATRVIGYLKLIENFAAPRQIEEGIRFYHNKRGNQ
jgi:ribonucleoside-triphosphate reductase